MISTFPVEFGGRVFRSSDFIYRGYVGSFPELLTRFNSVRAKTDYPDVLTRFTSLNLGELRVRVPDLPAIVPGTLLRFHNEDSAGEYFLFRYKGSEIVGPPVHRVVQNFLVGDIEFVALAEWSSALKINWVMSYAANYPRTSASEDGGLGTFHHRQMHQARLAMGIAAPGIGHEFMEDFDRRMFGPDDMVVHAGPEETVFFPPPRQVDNSVYSTLRFSQEHNGSSGSPYIVNYWASRMQTRMLNLGASQRSSFAFMVLCDSATASAALAQNGKRFYCGFSNKLDYYPMESDGLMFRIASEVNSHRWQFTKGIETPATYNSAVAANGSDWQQLLFVNNYGSCTVSINGSAFQSFSITTPDLWMYPFIGLHKIDNGTDNVFKCDVDYVYGIHLK